jgi:regulator of nucleoside diphosphate kinase
MTQKTVELTKTPITLTTGIYDLLKEHIRKKKLSRTNEEKLEAELKNAKQVLNRDLPANVVTVNTTLLVKDLETGEEIKRKFVSPQKARRKNGTTSILSAIGVATLGYAENAIIQWELPEGLRSYQVIEVARLT